LLTTDEDVGFSFLSFFLSFACGRFLFLMPSFCFGCVFGCHGCCQLQIRNKKSWSNAVRPLSTSSSIVCVCVCVCVWNILVLLENRRVCWRTEE
jgi:hypothetical protein